MTRLVLVYLFGILLTAHSATLQCGLNEMQVDCPANCLSDLCPSRSEEDQACPPPVPCPPPACKCIFNHRRAKNGTCIKTEDCPPFPCNRPHEVFVPCPNFCPTDACSQATARGDCPIVGLILIVVECVPKCQCAPNYCRRSNGVCV